MMKLKKLGSLVSLSLICGILQNISAAGNVDLSDADLKSSVSSAGIQDSKISIDVKYYDIVLKNAVLKEENLKLGYEIKELKQENEDLKKSVNRYKKQTKHLKKKLDEKKDYVSPEQLNSELERVRADMLLQFNKSFGEYIEKNPKKKMFALDLSSLFSDLITFNVNYTNNGNTKVSPFSVDATAKGTIAGAAITS